MKKGILLSVFASLLFSFLYYYSVLFAPLTSEEVFGWRIISTLLFSTLLLTVSKNWTSLFVLLKRTQQQPLLLIGIPLSGALLGVQMWLFVWAPIHGRALSTSLGYFLLPLMMVLAGRVVFREQLSRFQLLAVICAAIGVTHELIFQSSFSWDTLVVAIGFTLYFINRRYFKIEGLIGMFSDLLFTLPYALYFVVVDTKTATLFTSYPKFLLLIPMLGLISVVALYCYLFASRVLPLTLFGFLSYVEPLLLFVVALVFLNSPFQIQQLWTYIPIWLAILFLVLEGVIKYNKAIR